MTENLYPKLRLEHLEPHYSRHVSHMTSEGLHSKSDIAAQLAWRDGRLEALERIVSDSADHVGDLGRLERENESLRSELKTLRQALQILDDNNYLEFLPSYATGAQLQPWQQVLIFVESAYGLEGP